MLLGQDWGVFPAVDDPGPGDVTSLHCRWDFGDGQSAEIPNCGSPGTARVPHVYAAPGSYVARLTVTDRRGTVLIELPERGNVSKPVHEQLRSVLLQRRQPGAASWVDGDGNERIVGYVPIDAGPKGLTVALSLPRDMVLAPVRRAALRDGLTLAAAIGLGLFLAWFVARSKLYRPLSMLTHTAGLPLHYQFFYRGGPPVPPMDTAIQRYGVIVIPPGERFVYSNFGFGVLERIIERVGRGGYADVVTRSLLQPLGMNETVVSDGAGLDLATLRTLADIATDGLVPDRTFLLDLPVETGLARKAPGDITRFEAEFDLDFHRRVRAGFLALAAAEPARFHIVDATAGLDAVAREIAAVVDADPVSDQTGAGTRSEPGTFGARSTG